MNHELKGRTLVKIENVSIAGGDTNVDKGIADEAAALEKVKSFDDSGTAYFWCKQTNRLIEKNPNERTGRTVTQSGAFYMYADKVLGNGHSYLYSKINITSKDEITGLVRTQ